MADHFTLLLELLQVLGEINADIHHQIFSDQLPLPSIVVHLIQDVQKGLVAGQPIIQEEGERKGWVNKGTAMVNTDKIISTQNQTKCQQQAVYDKMLLTSLFLLPSVGV